MMANDKVLLGMGNPLLDMSVDVNKEFLAKYGVKVPTRSMRHGMRRLI